MSFLILSGCQSDSDIGGFYSLEVKGLKGAERAELELVGSEEEIFGELRFFGERERSFEVGFNKVQDDTVHFQLPGKNGYLKILLDDNGIVGSFKYFGLNAELTGVKRGKPSQLFLKLQSLQPIAAGTISTDQEESFPSIDATGKRLYFTRDNSFFYSEINDNGEFKNPIEITFNEEGTYAALRPISNRKNQAIFNSNRQIDTFQLKKQNLWLLDLEDGETMPLPFPINIDSLGDYHAGMSNSGTIYFSSYNREGGFGRSDIYTAMKNKNGYLIKNLGPAINSDKSESDLYIDPQERFLLFVSTDREDSFGSDDIYLSKKVKGKWTEPLNLGSTINTYAYEYGPWVDELNGYLYFNSYRRGSSDIYAIPLEEIPALDFLVKK